MGKRVVVAMSGGVDSSVAAGILRDEGWEVCGVYMKNWMNEVEIVGECPWEEDIEDARSAAEALGIEFRVVNLMKEYKERVVKYLLEGYRSGVTPNPDVVCNREIKFGVFLQWAEREGFEYVATGHYARKVKGMGGFYELYEGVDKKKDQSYFLGMLVQEQLAKAIFPLGGYEKVRVRELAREYGLRNADKKDSQGICFIGKVKMVDFLRAHLPDKPGPVYEAESGRYLGKHLGLHLYTIGQGRGVGIASPHKGRGYVVVRKDWERNALIMALEGEDAPGLYEKVCWLNDVSWPGSELKIPGEYGVRPRYRAAAERALVSKDGEWVKVEFEKPQRALTLGQVAVLYDGERVAGAGFIAMVGERKF